MRLLCHRGWWWPTGEKNSLEAILKAITSGYGVETDIRDCDGELVISHDPSRKAGATRLDDFLGAYRDTARKPCVALNIKSDGLQSAVAAKVREFGLTHCFAFDMSLPDTLEYASRKMPFAVRFSEYETDEQLLNEAAFVWMDAFRSDWYSVEMIERFLQIGKSVAIVSPELHRRDHMPLWRWLKPISTTDSLYLCTDFVNEALETFDVAED